MTLKFSCGPALAVAAVAVLVVRRSRAVLLVAAAAAGVAAVAAAGVLGTGSIRCSRRARLTLSRLALVVRRVLATQRQRAATVATAALVEYKEPALM
jgi:hypothetical protein